MEAYIKAYGVNQYYETVLKVIAHISNTKLHTYVLRNMPWYEIDDAQDLDIANTLFAPEDEKLQAYERHYGGYWRFPGLKDFCYLVNPYFPPQKLVDQMKYSYTPLLEQYPSGMEVQRLLAGKMFMLDSEYLLVGNGAAELINTLGKCVTTGHIIVSIPAFNEYVRCFSSCEVVSVNTSGNDYASKPMDMLDRAVEGDTVVLINPDNPSGQMIEREQLFAFLETCEAKGIRCVVDESFVDFADLDKRFSLLTEEALTTYPHMIVIKSISKSYGVPGVRLGIAASADHTLLRQMREAMPIWNINSFGEYFLQIYGLYASEYKDACNHIAENRRRLSEELCKIPYLTVYPSQSNYIMCRVSPPWTAKELATQLLTRHSILIKSLSQKHGFEGKEYVRIAVKDSAENEALIQALKTFV